MTTSEHTCFWAEETERLRALVAQQAHELEETLAQLAALTVAMQAQERELLELKKRITGRTSERSRPAKPRSEATRPKNDAEAQQKRKANRERRESLPVEPISHPVPPEDRGSCPNCGDPLRQMPDDVSSEYEYVPGHLVRRVHSRETWCCAGCSHFVRAKAPPRVVEGGQYGPGLVARTVVQKCADCVPLYRQVKAFGREGLTIARSTLVQLFHRAASIIEPLYQRLVALVVASMVVYADETSLKMQRVEKLGFIWTFASEAAVVYVFSKDRSGETPVAILGDSPGWLVVDGYTGYNHVSIPGRRTRAGCNSHARRKFVDVDDEHARYIIEHFKTVFDVERQAAERGIFGTPAHLALRHELARPAMNAIKACCDAHVDAYAPKSPLGKAMGYVRNQWQYLSAFLDDVTISPHNNLSERLLRIIALGRKNYLFVGHEDAGQNTAMLCSIIATCELYDVNPQEYLTDILVRLQDHPASQIDDLLPGRWRELFAPSRSP